MNYNELKLLINDYLETRQDEIDEDDSVSDYEDSTKELVQNEFDKTKLPISLVYENESFDGNDKEWVFEHKDGDNAIYIMFKGWYSSYEGIDVRDGFKEVTPYTFTETRYK